MIIMTVQISTKIVISYAMKWGILLWIWWKVNGNWDSNMTRISQWRESNCKTNTGIRRIKYIQNSRIVRTTVWNPSKKVNYLSKVIWERKILIEFTRSISSTRIGKPVLMMMLKSPRIKTSADGLINTSILDEIESKTVDKEEEGDEKRKEVRYWVK